jgi:thiosulfate/3-mercaptopyruvate sulfurtransferase
MPSGQLALFAIVLALGSVTPSHAVVPRAAGEVPGGDTAIVPILVPVEWLAARLDEPDLVVLHVGRDDEQADEHIPGGRSLPLSAIAVDQGTVRSEIPPDDVLQEALERAGISTDSRVVVYGEPLAAARAFMTLEYAGLRGRVGLLDGGLAAWREAGHPVSTEASTARRGRFSVRPRADVVVDAAWVAAHGQDPGILLLDVRSREEIEEGRIPGARHLFWRELLGEAPGSRVKDVDDLRRLLSSPWVASSSGTVVAYCATGMRASVAYVAARAAGLDVRLYDGSFTEWAQDPSRPIQPCC